MANTVRMNVSLPIDLVDKLKATVPSRGLSKFLADAAQEKVKKVESEKAFAELLVAPPAFAFLKGKDAATKWVRKMRRTDERRLRRLIGSTSSKNS